MARARNLKPGFFKNEDLSDLGPHAQLLFAGLWTLADKKGRLDDRSRRIKAELFPFYEVDVDGLLTALAESGFILRYEIDSNKYIQINNFEKHQRPHVKEAESTIPEPGISGASIGNSGTRTPLTLNPIPLTLNPQPLSKSGLSLFNEFWLAYPNKKSKGQAEKSWLKLNPNEQLHEAILHGVERAKTSEQWQKDGGKFIPHPSTWLNARGWEDEYTITTNQQVKLPKAFPVQ